MATDPLRIALISDDASPLAAANDVDAGGQDTDLAHVAQALAEAGHAVDVLTRRDDPALPAMVTPRRGMRVLHIDAGPPRSVPKEQLLRHLPAFAEAAQRLLRQSAPYDVLHANDFMSGWVGLALRLALGVPLVTRFHAPGLAQRRCPCATDQFAPARIGIERALAQRSDRLIAECPQDSDDLMRLYGTPPGRIATVPWGVDMHAFRPGERAAARQRLGLAPDRFLVLQLGPLMPSKGIDNVVQAMALLAPDLDAQLLVVFGAANAPDERLTPEIVRLRTLARDNGVTQRVRFVGRRDREPMRDWYLAADVFVTTPWYEPLGTAPLEAMACGRPVIGSRLAGIQDTVVDGVTGFLVPPGDPQSLAVRLGFLQANPALAAAMGRAGAHRVRQNFSWTRVARRLAEVYGEVVPAPEPAPVRLTTRPRLSLVLPPSAAAQLRGSAAP